MERRNSGSVVDSELLEMIFSFRKIRGRIAHEPLPQLGGGRMLFTVRVIRRIRGGILPRRIDLNLGRRGHRSVLLGDFVVKEHQERV